MAALVEVSSHPQKLKLRPPPGSQNVTSIARSGSIAVASGCSRPMMMKSKVPRLIVASLQRRNQQPDFAQKNKVDGVKSRRKNNGKLRKIFSVVFIGDRRGSSRVRGESTSKKAAEEEEEITNEPCKKKILMGGKCKPLNSSGGLHYDEEGILTAEPLPP